MWLRLCISFNGYVNVSFIGNWKYNVNYVKIFLQIFRIHLDFYKKLKNLRENTTQQAITTGGIISDAVVSLTESSLTQSTSKELARGTSNNETSKRPNLNPFVVLIRQSPEEIQSLLDGIEAQGLFRFLTNVIFNLVTKPINYRKISRTTWKQRIYLFTVISNNCECIARTKWTFWMGEWKYLRFLFLLRRCKNIWQRSMDNSYINAYWWTTILLPQLQRSM